MELTKRTTIKEIEEKIKELRSIEYIMGFKEHLKVINNFRSIPKGIDEKYNKIILEAGLKTLIEKKQEILTELEENGIVEHSIEPLKE